MPALNAIWPMRMKSGMTVNPYEARASKKSFAIRPMAAFTSTRYANPATPIIPMAIASSMPVIKKASNAKRKITPIAASLMAHPLDGRDKAGQEHETLDKGADAQNIRHGIVGYVEREGDLMLVVEIDPLGEEVPPEKEKEGYAACSCEDQGHLPDSP